MNRAPIHHEVKCHPEPFAKVRAQTKLFEIRVNDRDYREGDTITLYEWKWPEPTGDGRGIEPRYTGESEGPFTIGTVIPGGSWHLPEDVCVFSLRPAPIVEGETPETDAFYIRQESWLTDWKRLLDHARSLERRLRAAPAPGVREALPTRTIRIPSREQHEGFDVLTVTVPWVCLECGGPRGEPIEGLSFDGSRRVNVSLWTNPCGHLEKYSRVRAALSGLAAAPEGSEWQPMETAPRDGTAVLLWIPSWYQSKGGMTVGLYLNNEWGAINGFDVEPSAWMPLPPTPSTKEREA